MPANKVGGIRDASQESRGHQGCQPRKPGASGTPAKKAGYMWRNSLHVSGFFMFAEAAGRQGRGVSHTPSSHAPVYGANECSSCSNTVSSSFKHHSNVIQIQSCGPSVRGIRDACQAGRVPQTRTLIDSPASGLCRGWEAGRGHQGRLPRKPVTSNAYPAFFAGVRRRHEGSEMMKQVV